MKLKLMTALLVILSSSNAMAKSYAGGESKKHLTGKPVNCPALEAARLTQIKLREVAAVDAYMTDGSLDKPNFDKGNTRATK